MRDLPILDTHQAYFIERLLYLAIVLLHIVVLFVLPLFTDTHSFWRYTVLLLLGCSAVTHWALLHQAFHRHLHTDKQVNRWLGRGLAMLFPSPFRLIQFGHLLHHNLNGRACERADVIEAKQLTLKDKIIYYIRLSIGLYAAEVLACIGFFLPKPWAESLLGNVFDEHMQVKGDPTAAETLLANGGLWEARIDAGVGIALYGLAFSLYGIAWWQLALLLLFRGFWVSVMDNVFHYGAELNNPRQGFNLSLPHWLAIATLNFNFHGVHHRHATLRWEHLPQGMVDDEEAYDGELFNLTWQQFRGPQVLQAFENKI